MFYRGKSYPRPVLTYHVPFSGDMQLLRNAPSARIAWSMNMNVIGNALTFEIVVFTEDPVPVKQEGEQVLNNLEQQLGYLASDSTNFNESLESKIRSLVEGRKAEFDPFVANSREGRAVALPFLDAELKARPVTKSCPRREVDGRSRSEFRGGIV